MDKDVTLMADSRSLCSPEVWAQYEAIEQEVADGNLCSVNGEPCDTERVDEEYGADRDGNRGIWVHYYRCRNCGEER